MDIIKLMKKYFTDSNYYSMLNLLKQETPYNVLLSARDTGKSFQIKHFLLLDAILNDRYFVYIRRYGVEMKVALVNSYWEDVKLPLINKICGTDYDTIQCVAGEIYMCKYVENTTTPKREKRVGRTVVLATAGHIKSTVFKNYYNVLLEEFITEQGYLFDEPRLLMDCISTILRDNVGLVFLLGNLIYRDFPYLGEWGLSHIFDLKSGEIQIYEIDGVKISVELCDNTASNRTLKSMFFGNAKKNIVGGEYVTQSQPHLPFNYKDAEPIYKLTILHSHMKYRLEILEYENQLSLFVHPCNDGVLTHRIVTKQWEYDLLSTRYLYGLTEGDKIVIDLIKKDCVYFSDNLTGTEFRKIIKEYLK